MRALDFEVKECGMCAKHEVPLLLFAGRTACPVCQREKIAEQDKLFVEKAERQHMKRRTYDRLAMDSILMDYSLKEASFQSFLEDDEESIANKKKARVLAGRYLTGETFNTILTGTAGAGKSHLAMSMLKAVNDNADPWRSCLFVSLDEFLLSIRETFDRNNKETERSVIEHISDVDLLVLDDLGAETGFIGTNKTATDFTQRILYSLMNRRQDKSTIITTNLTGAQLATMYDKKILSRMYRKIDGNVITFNGTKDRRMIF